MRYFQKRLSDPISPVMEKAAGQSKYVENIQDKIPDQTIKAGG